MFRQIWQNIVIMAYESIYWFFWRYQEDFLSRYFIKKYTRYNHSLKEKKFEEKG